MLARGATRLKMLGRARRKEPTGARRGKKVPALRAFFQLSLQEQCGLEGMGPPWRSELGAMSQF